MDHIVQNRILHVLALLLLTRVDINDVEGIFFFFSFFFVVGQSLIGFLRISNSPIAISMVI